MIPERPRRDGYDGGTTILKDYLHDLRPLFADAKSYQRSSYVPGEFGQTDWEKLEVSAPVSRERARPVFGLGTTLSHPAGWCGGRHLVGSFGRLFGQEHA